VADLRLDRPYTLLSCAMSLDGYLDRSAGPRLLLSNAADLDRVDEVRAGCDAILVGAATVRNDNPRLVLRDPARSAARVARGLPPTPWKVTVTAQAKLDPAAYFFTTGESRRLVYCAGESAVEARGALAPAAEVVDAGPTVSMREIAADLHARGVSRLMVEGGRSVLTQFLTEGLADELQLVVAPFFLGDARAPRFPDDGVFPWCPEHPARLADVRRLDEVVLLTYALSDRFCPHQERDL